MGAKCIFDIEIAGASAGMAEHEIMRRVEAHTGRKRGKWDVVVNEYGSPPVQSKKRRPVQAVILSDVTTVYTIVGPTVIEVEKTMLPLMRKISAYQVRFSRAIRGNEYDFEDFRVRVGLSFDRNGGPSGVVVEIEYRPCATVSECEGLINVLMERIAAPLVPPPQTNQDGAVNEAGLTYKYKKATPDEQTRVPDTQPFTNRAAALIYAKLLRVQ